MIEKAKIQFSTDELSLMQNREWILTKNRIIDKVATGLDRLAITIHNEIAGFYPGIADALLPSGYKVSRGEKYQGLPYLILDLPRIFGKQDVLAIRLLFWWGNYYNITLHTKGKYADGLREALVAGETLPEELLISVNGDEWNHDLLHADYRRLDDVHRKLLAKSTDKQHFIKLARRVTLMQWEEAEKELYAQFHQFLQLICISFQYGGRGL